jgi:two-component system, cell cycle sensor histidine kinase and response regulator CckA
MAKVLRCRDVGMDCGFVMQADTEEEILQHAAAHACMAHNMQEMPVEVMTTVRTVIREIRSPHHNLLAEKWQAEEALQRHLEWLHVTLASIADAVMATNPAGALTFMNPVAAALTGWPAQEAVGLHIDAVLRLSHAQIQQPVQGPVHRVLQTGDLVGFEPATVLVTRQGQARPIAGSGVPIRGSNGILQGVVIAFRDMSESRRLEDHLRQAQKIEAIGTLAGGIAHDFNNILSAILGFTELAAYDVPQASAAGHCLREVLIAGKRAKELVQQLLAFSRKTMTERTPIRLHALLQEALAILRATLPSPVQLDTHIADEAGTVLADATQMHQVLMNLCANAEYAMRHTGGILEVRLEAVDVDAALASVHPDLKPGPYSRLTVRDTGPGMTPEVLERIFEPYFTTKPQGEGTGMGLAVVHGIVASHGGTMTVTSAPGQGTTFEVYLPRQAEVVPHHPSPAEHKNGSRSSIALRSVLGYSTETLEVRGVPGIPRHVVVGPSCPV